MPLLSLVRIEDPQAVAPNGQTHHANVTFNGSCDSRVSGMVFETTELPRGSRILKWVADEEVQTRS